MRPGVWARWQAAAGPWQGWSVCPSLLAPEADDIVPLPVRAPAANRLATQLAKRLDRGVLMLLELDPVLGVQVAARLNQWGLANAVLVLPRWPYQNAILPVDGLLYALVTQARRLCPEAALPNVVFVVDAERSRPVPDRSAADQRADNRYRLLVPDLPDLKALRARGVQRVELEKVQRVGLEKVSSG
jgi:hypothetical protein